MNVEAGQLDRTGFLGGSDIAAVVELSPWATPLKLYEKKTGTQTEQPSRGKKRLFSRGHVWEKVVAEMLVQRLEADGHQVEIVATNQIYIDPDVPYFSCEIDFEIRLDGEEEITNVELKTVHPFAAREWGEDDSDECPVHYAAQAMWGMGITGRKRCLVAPLFGADEIRVYPVERDDATIIWLRERGADFWTLHVIPRRQPAPINLGDLKRAFPKAVDETVTGHDEHKAAALRYLSLDAQIEALSAQRDEVEFFLKGYMGPAVGLVLPGETTPAVTWKDRAWSALDQAGLKEAHPDIHKRFMQKGTSRVFNIRKIPV